MGGPDPYQNMKESLGRGEVVAFVGAGLSVGAGLPDWYTLVSELSERINYDLPPARRAHPRSSATAKAPVYGR